MLLQNLSKSKQIYIFFPPNSFFDRCADDAVLVKENVRDHFLGTQPPHDAGVTRITDTRLHNRWLTLLLFA